MFQRSLTFRAITLMALIFFAQLTIPLSDIIAQESNCAYSQSAPTLENARISFQILDYECAEQEIESYLNQNKLTIEQKADAHVLMAAVYYAKLKDDKNKKSQVINQFKEAFKSYRDWRGELDISSTEFFEMMQQAKKVVDEESQKEVVKEEVKPPETKVETPPPTKPSPPKTTIGTKKDDAGGKKKAWYSQWWAIALGVGLVAGVAVAAGGGSSDDGGGTGAVVLDDPPEPPPTK